MSIPQQGTLPGVHQGTEGLRRRESQRAKTTLPFRAIAQDGSLRARPVDGY